MKRIPLGNSGKHAIIDDEDYEHVSKFNWVLQRNQKGMPYVKCQMHIGNINGHDITCRMSLHRFLLHPPEGMEVDHRNHNGLDCRRSNIRICTHAENMANQLSCCRNKSSAYKGVRFHKKTRKWRAAIMKNYKCYSLGLYHTEKEAALAYNHAALRLFGEFAYLNILRESLGKERIQPPITMIRG